jgi:hypothetical protein
MAFQRRWRGGESVDAVEGVEMKGILGMGGFGEDDWECGRDREEIRSREVEGKGKRKM